LFRRGGGRRAAVVGGSIRGPPTRRILPAGGRQGTGQEQGEGNPPPEDGRRVHGWTSSGSRKDGVGNGVPPWGRGGVWAGSDRSDRSDGSDAHTPTRSHEDRRHCRRGFGRLALHAGARAGPAGAAGRRL